MINLETFFSSQQSGTSSGEIEYVYIPYSNITVELKDNSFNTELENLSINATLLEAKCEATLQEDIYQAILYDDREADLN